MSLTRNGRSCRHFSSWRPGRCRCRPCRSPAAATADHCCLLTNAPSYEPHGFESLVPIGVHLHACLQAVAERPDHCERHLDGEPSRLRASTLVAQANDPLARVVEGIDFDLPFSERLRPFSDKAVYALNPLVELLLRPATEPRHIPDEVRSDDLLWLLPSSQEVLPAAPHDLHVLLRHRLLLQPCCSQR